MGAGEFRGDGRRLESLIEEMARVVYGLPVDEKSKVTSKETAALLLTLSRVRFEKEEEPIVPRLPLGGEKKP